MKKILLSLLVVLGTVSGLNAARQGKREDRVHFNRSKTHAVDKDVSDKMCNIMMSSPKSFKSMGMEKCYDCHCRNGVMACKCMQRLGGPVLRFKKMNRYLNFNDPHNHPVIVVTEKGRMELMPLEHFEKNKAYQEKYIDPNLDHKDMIIK